MAENIIMPQLGESIAEGTIVKWLKKPGDPVKKDENILLISTDKVEAEIPSPCAGILLEISVDPGETVAVGTVLGKVGAEGEQPTKEQSEKSAEAEQQPKESAEETRSTEKGEIGKGPFAEEQAEKTKAPATASIQADTSETSGGSMAGFLSPLVRRIAQENKISEAEIAQIRGTGRDGRVSKKDILAYIESRGEAKTAQVSVSTAAGMSFMKEEQESTGRTFERPISTMRRIIMDNMVASKATSAHVTTFFEIDYTAIDKVRSEHKNRFKQDEQVSLTYTTFLAAACCQVLKRHPYINAKLQKDSVVFNKDVHLGIAVAIEQPEPGLMVPVIRNADKQNLRGLAHAINDLSTRVRQRKISPDELSGGTFTITNPGNYGAVIGTPIINQPQVAILGVGNIKKQATVLDVDGTDVIAIRRMGILGLSFDHRLIDGATADIFMQDLKHTLETWSSAP